ncbi:transcription elongation factor GreA [Candidatus Comchoanobacter bicostacola]|uniref:Transcription elongation factor GreA n=1 Tax=Candidatus Comchoanobacter bicostacola TaxID=2919598 RepID=A0ABY5DKZ9_9GAMM|nr:transcription elongation factor GreA [Candidatus Comchoanobacter bicostacola]UTC24632.1 transcription elongation factor GreA [Candidatus Comchoanobacter bicostacola]
MNRVPLTLKGEIRIREQLTHLKSHERQKIRQALEEARAHGDLKENAEYHAAKEAQGIMEAKISYLEQQLQASTVIDVAHLPNHGKVVFGATVVLENIETDELVTYQIVGEVESDIDQGLISFTSPIARACIGNQAADIISVETPKGIIEYEIKSIDLV